MFRLRAVDLWRRRPDAESSREEIAALLSAPGVPPGAYCLRKSRQETVVAVLCVRNADGSGVSQFRIDKGPEVAEGKIELLDTAGGGEPSEFDSLYELIAHVKTQGVGAQLVGVDLGGCLRPDDLSAVSASR